VKEIAYLLIGSALIVGLSVRIFVPHLEWAYAGAGLALLLGSLFLITNGATRLWKGNVKLRPWDATRKAWWMFLVILGMRLIAQFIFPNLKLDVVYAIFQSALIATIFSLHSTAYRKPE
jgi:hypothetical protein